MFWVFVATVHLQKVHFHMSQIIIITLVVVWTFHANRRWPANFMRRVNRHVRYGGARFDAGRLKREVQDQSPDTPTPAHIHSHMTFLD